MLDLALFGAANPDHGLLDLTGGVFKHRQRLIGRCDDRHPARLPEL